ncbi:hypothetical protein BS47DRAFT_1254226, partial [Hydnum rufescens UP504]
WLHTINSRLALDKLMTNTTKFKKNALPSALVLCTWSGTLLHKTNLPANWIWESGVLVGIGSRCPQ